MHWISGRDLWIETTILTLAFDYLKTRKRSIVNNQGVNGIVKACSRRGRLFLRRVYDLTFIRIDFTGWIRYAERPEYWEIEVKTKGC